MGTKQTTIVLVAKDLASGNIKRVSQELSQLGPGGKLAAVGLGTTMAATSGVERGLSHLRGTVGNLASGIGVLAGGAGVLGLAGALTSATSQATSFQSSMEMLATQAGASQAEVDSMTAAILKLSPSVATGPNELAAGLYHIESAGLRGAKAIDVLTAAAQGAKVGNADLESVTNALVASVNSGVKGTTSMTQAMGVLNAIVGAGNMRMQDLTDAMGTGILSTAKTFGISLQSVGAAIADMTNQGVPAIDAATRLRMTISLLGAPTSKAATELKSIGLGQADLANAMRGPGGILDAVQMLSQHMQKAGLIDANGNVSTAGADLLSKAFGGGKSSSAIMTLIGSVGKLGDIQKQVTQGAGTFGDAWAKTQQDAQFKFEKFQAAMSTMLIDLGNAVLPTMTDAASAIGDFISQNQTQIADSFKNAVATIRSIAGTVASVIGPMFGVIKSAWGALPGPLQQLLIGGFVAEKASKFLFGMSPIAGVKDLLGLTMKGGLGSILGGLTSRGSTPANPVFTSDVTKGIGGIGEAVAGGGLMNAFLASVGGAAFATAVAGVATVVIGQWINENAKPALPNVTQTGGAGGGGGGGGFGGAARFATQVANAPGDRSAEQRQHYLDSNAGIDRTFVNDQRSHFDDLNTTLNSTSTAIVDTLDTLHTDLQNQLAVLRTSKEPAAIAAAVTAITKDVLLGTGGVLSNTNLLNRLKAERATATDPALIAALDAAIAKIGSHIKGEQWIQAQKDAATKIANSNEPVKQKLADLERIQKDLLSHGDTVAAETIQKLQDLITAVGNIHITIASTGTGTYSTVAHPVNKNGPGKASGGPVEPGVLYPVGERGPEYFSPRIPGQIIPNGGLPTVLHVTVHPPGVSARQNNVADAQWRRFSPNNRTVQAI